MSTNQANSAFHPCGVDKWVVKLHLDVCCLSCGGTIWWTLTKQRQAWCCLQVKLCDPRLNALWVCMRTKMALYKYSSFPFLSLIQLLQHRRDIRCEPAVTTGEACCTAHTAVLLRSCWHCTSQWYLIRMRRTQAGVSPASNTAHGWGLDKLKSSSWWSSQFGRLSLMWCQCDCFSWVCCWDGLGGILLMRQLLRPGCEIYTLPSPA